MYNDDNLVWMSFQTETLTKVSQCLWPHNFCQMFRENSALYLQKCKFSFGLIYSNMWSMHKALCTKVIWVHFSNWHSNMKIIMINYTKSAAL